MEEIKENKIHDLRSALELLQRTPGEYVETSVEVDPHAELSGVYRYVGAGGTCERPTRKNGPVMMFNSIKGLELTVPVSALASCSIAHRKNWGIY